MRKGMALVGLAVTLVSGCTADHKEDKPNGDAAASTAASNSGPSAAAAPVDRPADAAKATNAAASASAGPDSGESGRDEQPGSKANRWIRYACENGKTVRAQYVESGALQQVANLEIGGKLIGLSETRAASGSRYEADQGLSSGKKLIWWTKGASAMLIESTAGSADESIVNCQEAAG